MKKTYMNPTTTVVMIEVAQMIATSGFSDELGNSEQSGGNALDRSSEDLWSDE